MKDKKTPHQGLGGTAIVELALEIESIRTANPEHYARIMRKLEELEKVEHDSRK